MPLPITPKIKCTKMTVTIGCKLNIGNYEGIDFAVSEEYSLDGGRDNSENRTALLAAISAAIRETGARLVQPLDITGTGKAPAGQLACLFKTITEES